jgi:hypothetical protein
MLPEFNSCEARRETEDLKDATIALNEPLL